MPHRPMSRALLTGVTFFALLAGTHPARADVFLETSYVVPTSSVFATSYVPTSSVFATSYVVPTSETFTYSPTSSIMSVGDVYTTSSTYYPVSRYYRYRPRRYVERTSYLSSPSISLMPTSYVVPTSYLYPTTYLAPTSYVIPRTYITPTSYLLDSSLVTTSGSTICCETAPAAPTIRPTATRAPGSGGNAITSEPSNSTERRPSGSVDDGASSNVTPPVASPPTAPKTTPREPAGISQPGPLDPGVTPPTPTPPPVGGGAGEVQIPPAGQIGGSPRSEESFRESRRPSNYDVRNILRGKVVSYDSGRPEEGVTVIVSSKTQNFTDRPAMTDAFGAFNVSLPDGDWTVKVRMPSGSVLAVGRDFLTASSGRVTDSSGRSVKEFLITR